MKRRERRESERVGGNNCKQEMKTKLACLKSKGNYLKKIDRGLELAETLTEKRTREYKARTSKARSEAFEAKAESA